MLNDAAKPNTAWDPELLEQFRRGDPAAAELLARRACRLALRTAATIVRSREEAADIAQDVAVDVLGSVHGLRDARVFDAWVHRITVRHSLRHLGRRSRVRRTETPLPLLAESDEPAMLDGTDRESLLAARGVLATALAELPPRQRLALALRYVHDLSDAEIAAALGCRQGTVHALLSRARSTLRRDPNVAQLAPALSSGGCR